MQWKMIAAAQGADIDDEEEPEFDDELPPELIEAERKLKAKQGSTASIELEELGFGYASI